MKSIKIKLMFLYITLVFIVMIIIGTYILASLKKYELKKINTSIINYANYLDEQIINNIKSPQDFQDSLKNIFYSTKNNMQCSILNSRGATIASSVLPYENYSNQAVIKALNGEESFCYLKEKINNARTQDKNKVRTWYNYARPSKFLYDKYIIFIRVDSKDFLDIIFNMAMTLVLSLVMALILAGAIGFLFAGTLTEPIRILSNKAKELANGNLKQEIIIINSNDEIGELTSSFNYMSQELNNTMQKLVLENNKLEIILQNMNDGIVYFDNAGNVMHFNYAVENLLGFSLLNINFDDLIKKLGLKNDLNAYKNNLLLNADETISINNKYLAANFISYRNKDSDNLNQDLKGILLVIQDITKHKKLDNMRQEFVANVSHEIRTPLTTIKAYSETLLDGGLEDKNLANKFLSIINNEADRISLLSKDLLELSRFDNNQMNFDFKIINLCEIINKSIEQNKILADKKNQKISFDQANDIYLINADANRINQVFSNIISNAIKYSFENKSIDIYIEETSKYIRAYVKDQGFGIPKDDLHNIFDRFYRVDKARSRMMGGTGLGLSIAKKIMEAHGGTINVNSKLDFGTTMIIRFNKPDIDNNNNNNNLGSNFA